MRQAGLFGLSDHLKRLSAFGDPLEELARIVDFEVFRPALVAALAYSDGARGGRPPYDPVAMLKVLILAAQNSVSYARMEYLIRDRLSWLRFLGFDLGAATPDANTIRLFREKLTEAGTLETLFAAFNQELKERGYLAMGGQIVDATLVAAPKRRNTQTEKEAIKEGKSASEIWPRRTGQGSPEGHGCTLDAEVHESAADAGRQTAGGYCDPQLWLQKQHLDLLPVRVHPQGQGYRWGSLRWAYAPGRGDQRQYGVRCLGRYRLPQPGERTLAAPER